MRTQAPTKTLIFPAYANDPSVGSRRRLGSGGHFLFNQISKSSSALTKALQRGIVNLKGGNKPYFFKRVYRYMYPPEPVNPAVLKIIFKTWNHCFVSLLKKNDGRAVQRTIHQLVRMKKRFPNEFRASVPGLSDAALKKALYHLYAIGCLFTTFEASKKNKPVIVERDFNKALHYFHKGGISKNDPSLTNYKIIFLKSKSEKPKFLS